MQWGESRAVQWLYRFYTTRRSCATAPGEEELELERRNAENVLDVFYALARFRVKEWVSLSSV